MKIKSGYFMGSIILFCTFVLWSFPFIIISTILNTLLASVIKSVGILHTTSLIIDTLSSMGIAYFSIKTFLKKRETPNNKKLIISVFIILCILNLGLIILVGNTPALVMFEQTIQIVLVYFVVLYSIKKNSIVEKK